MSTIIIPLLNPRTFSKYLFWERIGIIHIFLTTLTINTKALLFT